MAIFNSYVCLPEGKTMILMGKRFQHGHFPVRFLYVKTRPGCHGDFPITHETNPITILYGSSRTFWKEVGLGYNKQKIWRVSRLAVPSQTVAMDSLDP